MDLNDFFIVHVEGKDPKSGVAFHEVRALFRDKETAVAYGRYVLASEQRHVRIMKGGEVVGFTVSGKVMECKNIDVRTREMAWTKDGDLPVPANANSTTVPPRNVENQDGETEVVRFRVYAANDEGKASLLAAFAFRVGALMYAREFMERSGRDVWVTDGDDEIIAHCKRTFHILKEPVKSPKPKPPTPTEPLKETFREAADLEAATPVTAGSDLARPQDVYVQSDERPPLTVEQRQNLIDSVRKRNARVDDLMGDPETGSGGIEVTVSIDEKELSGRVRNAVDAVVEKVKEVVPNPKPTIKEIVSAPFMLPGDVPQRPGEPVNPLTGKPYAPCDWDANCGQLKAAWETYFGKAFTEYAGCWRDVKDHLLATLGEKTAKLKIYESEPLAGFPIKVWFVVSPAGIKVACFDDEDSARTCGSRMYGPAYSIMCKGMHFRDCWRVQERGTGVVSSRVYATPGGALEAASKETRLAAGRVQYVAVREVYGIEGWQEVVSPGFAWGHKTEEAARQGTGAIAQSRLKEMDHYNTAD